MPVVDIVMSESRRRGTKIKNKYSRKGTHVVVSVKYNNYIIMVYYAFRETERCTNEIKIKYTMHDCASEK